MAESHDVTVLGCGLMGAALARTLAGTGRAVAVWNRSHEKAEALASPNIIPMRDLGAAVSAAPLVIACLTTYDTTQRALEPIADWAGKSLVNVASATPLEVMDFAAWAAARGAEYLDGTIIGYPDGIGTEAASILYSGSVAAWDQHAEALTALSPLSMCVSEQVNAASVLNLGLVGAFLVPAMSAWVEAVTYMFGQGIDPELVGALMPATLESFRAESESIAAAIAAGDHASDQATIATYAEALHGSLDTMAAAGQSTRLLSAAIDNLNRAVEAGLGGLGFSAQAKMTGA